MLTWRCFVISPAVTVRYGIVPECSEHGLLDLSVCAADCQCCVLCKRKHARECDVRGVGAARQVKVQPHETLFRVGDSSEAGIFIVVEGRLGVFLQVLRRLRFWPSGHLPDVLCRLHTAEVLVWKTGAMVACNESWGLTVRHVR